VREVTGPPEQIPATNGCRDFVITAAVYICPHRPGKTTVPIYFNE